MVEVARVVLAVMLATASGCTGAIGDPGGSDPDPTRIPDGVDPLTHPAGLGAIGVRRLTRTEYRQTLLDLTGIDPGADVEFLPEDAETPFDNDYLLQVPSRTLVEAIKAIADRVAANVLSDPAARDRIVGCAPTGPDDEACLRSFIAAWGRLVLRRPLTDEEVDGLATLSSYSIAESDFYVGVGLVIRALLQDMEFVYRIEVGEPTSSGELRLTPHELAARLSYFLWGSTPDENLLDAAEVGALDDAAGVRSIASTMLADPRAARRLERFHALWLGYDSLRHPAALATSMRAEADALVRRAVLEEPASWYTLLTADDTFIDDAMAEIYGLPAPGSAQWVSWGDTGRRGLLSGSAFLSGGSKFGDTSPVLRGILVRERLLCQEVPPPPPTVDTDEPPARMDPTDCKVDRYAAHRTGGCANCHALIDPVGFGLEAYDSEGRFREHDVARPECVISGDGELVDLGMTFNGPAELSEALIDSDLVDDCLVTHLYQFTVGRPGRDEDLGTVGALTDSFGAAELRLNTLLLDLVSSEAFRHRVVETDYDRTGE